MLFAFMLMDKAGAGPLRQKMRPVHKAYLAEVQDRVLEAGEAVDVQFTVSNFTDIAAFQFALQFDPAQLAFDHIETVPANLASLSADGHFGLYNLVDGEIRSVWTNTQGQNIENGLTVFHVHFIAQQSGLKLSEVLELKPKALPEVAYTNTLEARQIQLVYLPVEVVTGTGDLVKAVVPKGKYAGTHVGRVSIRTSGKFNITTASGLVQGISHRHCQVIQRVDGYAYATRKEERA